MKKLIRCLSLALVGATLAGTAHADHTNTAPQTLTLPDCLNLALKQNPAILKAEQEIRRTRGLIVEARSAALPQVSLNGEYTQIDKNFSESFPGASTFDNQQQPWAANIRVTQLLFSGEKVTAAIRGAKLLDQIAVLDFDRTVANTLLEVRAVFYRVLLNQAQVTVTTQSIVLLEQQLTDARHRFAAGTVPQFDVLRAEVELANARPPYIRAQNDLRLSRETLVRLLALDPATGSPRTDFTPIQFTGELKYIPATWNLTNALQQALAHRPELHQAQKQVGVATENIKVNASGYWPELYLFGGYGVRNKNFNDSLDATVRGWNVGASATWNIFDGFFTKGRVQQARAEKSRAELDLSDTYRNIELEVRRAYSNYIEALQLLQAQEKTVEQALESQRLAEARFRAGTGTQLDVLSAQTALTQARSNEVQALHDYNVALATLERATGLTTKIESL
jgi:TolC family type I secretion outer membrane protein